MVEQGPGLGNHPGRRHDRPQVAALQPTGPSGQDRALRRAAGDIVWGDIPGGNEKACAHANANMSCIACHSSWNPSCFGCHLPQTRQQEDAAASQRGRRHAQLRLVQLPDAARRCVHAGTRRRRDRQPDRPGAVVVRDPRRVVQRATASRSTSSSRRSRPRGSRASPSAPTCRTRSGADRRCSTT